MPWWYYEKKDLRITPSSKDGIGYDLECQYRREGAQFIKEISSRMDLGHHTMATAVVYFHRFYMVHSFAAFPKYLTACCALFLAGKVEETPKKARDIIKMAEKCLPAAEFAKFGDDPKEELLILERIILQSIKFDLQVDHPYDFLTKYVKSLLRGVTRTSERQKMDDLLQMAWNFVNDSLCTIVCLQWEPEVIAVAMLYLAAKLSKYNINHYAGKTANQTEWWEMFVNGVTLDLLEDICHQILDYYSPDGTTSSTSSAPRNSTSSKSITSAKSLDVPPPPPLPKSSLPPPKPVVIQPLLPVEPMILTPTSVLPPPLGNSIPSLSTMNYIYPPPSSFSVPPPGMSMNPPPSHDGIAPPYHYLYNRY